MPGECLCALVGSGELYVEDRAQLDNGKWGFGNGTELSITTEENKIDLPNYVTGQGNCASVSLLSTLGFTGTFSDFCAKNMTLATRGLNTNTPAATVVPEPLVLYPGRAAFLTTLPDHTDTANWSVATAGGATPLVEDVDYVRLHSGIYGLASSPVLLANPPADPETPNVQVGYGGLATDTIQTFTDPAKEYRLIFDGKNLNDGLPYQVTIHRVKFSPISGIPINSTEFASYDLTAEVLSDSTISAVGTSQFFVMKRVAA